MTDEQVIFLIENYNPQNIKAAIHNFTLESKNRIGENVITEQYEHCLMHVADVFYKIGDINMESAISLLEQMKVATKGKSMDCNVLIDMIIKSFKTN